MLRAENQGKLSEETRSGRRQRREWQERRSTGKPGQQTTTETKGERSEAVKERAPAGRQPKPRQNRTKLSSKSTALLLYLPRSKIQEEAQNVYNRTYSY